MARTGHGRQSVSLTYLFGGRASVATWPLCRICVFHGFTSFTALPLWRTNTYNCLQRMRFLPSSTSSLCSSHHETVWRKGRWCSSAILGAAKHEALSGPTSSEEILHDGDVLSCGTGAVLACGNYFIGVLVCPDPSSSADVE